MVTNKIRASRAPFAVPDVEARQASVERGIRALLDAELRQDDLRALLDAALWRYTEFHSSYNFAVRFRTRNVIETDGMTIQHEHVVGRAWLKDRILANPARLHDYLELAVACVVTVEEHAALGNEAFGWQRYIDAGIDVLDTVTLTSLDLRAASAAQRESLRRLGEGTPLTVDEADTEIAADRVIGLAKHLPNPDVHLEVFNALSSLGYVTPEHGGRGYVSFHDPATGRNFLNLTPTRAWIVRADLRTTLEGIRGVNAGGRHPVVDLETAGAVEVITELGRRFKV